MEDAWQANERSGPKLRAALSGVFQLTAPQNPLQFRNAAEKTGIWSVSPHWQTQQCARLPVGEFVFVSLLLDWTCKVVFLQIN